MPEEQAQVIGRADETEDAEEFDPLHPESPMAIDAADAKDISLRCSHYGLGMLSFMLACNFLDRQILNILQELIKHDMGLSDTQLGLLSGFSFALFYATAGFPIAWLADRSNRRNIVTLAIATWSIMTCLSGYSKSYAQLLVARVGVGIGEAGASPPAHSKISDFYPPKKRAMALAVYGTGVHGGIIIGLLMGGFVGEGLGWRVAFVVVGAPGIVFAFVFGLTVKEPSRGRWETGPVDCTKPSPCEMCILLLGNRSFWYIVGACSLAAFEAFSKATFMPAFLMRVHGLSIRQAGVTLSIVVGCSSVASSVFSGYVTDRLGVRDMRWYVWLPGMMGCSAIPLMFPIFLLNDTRVVILFMCVLGLAHGSFLAPSVAVLHAMFRPNMRAWTSATLLFVMNLLGMGMGPLFTGALSDRFTVMYGAVGVRYALLAAGIVGSFGNLLFFAAGRTLPSDLESMTGRPMKLSS